MSDTTPARARLPMPRRPMRSSLRRRDSPADRSSRLPRRLLVQVDRLERIRIWRVRPVVFRPLAQSFEVTPFGFGHRHVDSPILVYVDWRAIAAMRAAGNLDARLAVIVKPNANRHPWTVLHESNLVKAGLG